MARDDAQVILQRLVALIADDIPLQRILEPGHACDGTRELALDGREVEPGDLRAGKPRAAALGLPEQREGRLPDQVARASQQAYMRLVHRALIPLVKQLLEAA